MTHQEGPNLLQSVKPEQVRQAYMGPVGRCACGCSGEWFDKNDAPTIRALLDTMQRQDRRKTPVEVFTGYRDGMVRYVTSTARHMRIIDVLPADHDCLANTTSGDGGLTWECEQCGKDVT